MKAYKVELLIIDFDQIGEEEIRYQIEDTKYSNHCISPQVKKIEERDIGEWYDDHPLNSSILADEEYNRLWEK